MVPLFVRRMLVQPVGAVTVAPEPPLAATAAMKTSPAAFAGTVMVRFVFVEVAARMANRWAVHVLLAPTVAVWLPVAPAAACVMDETSSVGPLVPDRLYASVSAAGEARGPGGVRTATVSTHVPLLGDAAAVAAAAQARARATLRLRAPEVDAAIVHALPASPRTFERFTGRSAGAVGGIPRRVGVGQYATMFPRPVADGLWMVGDTVFPGQSTLATAIGGQRAAVASMR